ENSSGRVVLFVRGEGEPGRHDFNQSGIDREERSDFERLVRHTCWIGRRRRGQRSLTADRSGYFFVVGPYIERRQARERHRRIGCGRRWQRGKLAANRHEIVIERDNDVRDRDRQGQTPARAWVQDRIDPPLVPEQVHAAAERTEQWSVRALDERAHSIQGQTALR